MNGVYYDWKGNLIGIETKEDYDMDAMCNDNRFEVIGEAKKHLLEATNIDTSPDEMAVLDNFLFRCWQMGWLDRYDETRITDINGLACKIHGNAVEHGFWSPSPSYGEIIALCHSELSEALEAYRSHQKLVWNNEGKPDGMAVEMIDCVIRIFDALAAYGINIEEVIKMKMDYNKTRSYRHGDKAL